MRFLTKTVRNRLISQYALITCIWRSSWRVLPGYQEHNNSDGVCLKKDSLIVEHVPRRISRIVVLSKEDWRH